MSGNKQNYKQNYKQRGVGLYMKNILHRSIEIPFKDVGSNIVEILTDVLKERYSGICIKEGYVRNDYNFKLINNSAGTIVGDKVKFNTSFECLICKPVEGMLINVVVKNVTKAGVRCELKGENSPIIVFIARDHHFHSKEFSNIKIDDEIRIKTIGIRYELNDKYISIIGEYVINNRPKLTISNKLKVIRS
jgi:DNA-directed RNA polymerase subunit E'/Rpb7